MGGHLVSNRRAVLRALTAGAGLAAFPALLGFSPGPGRGSGAMVMVIRHGEKPDKSGSPAGIDLNGQPDDHSLTERGWYRAIGLVELFDPEPGSVDAGLRRPDAIYAAAPRGAGSGERTRQTVGPLAAQLGIPVNTSYGKGDESALVAQAFRSAGATLICWQHGEIPAIGAAFAQAAQVAPRPPISWPDERYDVVWVFAATGSGWRFTQVPERLLPGDGTSGFT